jgi:3-phosphoshikimate 1-carboxyvinyltransferase
MFAAMATGRSSLSNLSTGDDVRATRVALEALGVGIRMHADRVTVSGRGLAAWREPEGTLDCANSGTTMRVLAGALAGRPFLSVLTGDASLHQRPMRRVTEPLRAMGAHVDGRDDGAYAPLAIRGAALRGMRHDLTVPSAQVKSSLMLAGLQADGATEIVSPAPSRDHTERMLAALGVRVEVEARRVRVEAGAPEPFELDVPGDPSSAAFFVVAALITAGSDLTIESLALNPTRLGFVEVLRRMGGDIEIVAAGERCGEPVGDLRVRSSALTATTIRRRDPERAGRGAGVGRRGRVRRGRHRGARRGRARGEGEQSHRGAPPGARSVRGRGRDASRRARDSGRAPPAHDGPEPRRPPHRDGRGRRRQRDRRGEHDSRLASGRFVVPRLRRRPGVGDRRVVSESEARVVAIDGPSGSGKSTIAGGVACALGLSVLDTGAMYRAVALTALEHGVALDDEPACAALAREHDIAVEAGVTTVDGRDVSDAIRGPEATAAVSIVAAQPAVRKVLVAQQRAWVERHGGGVVEGRDIGTVVFPAAPLKVYLTASDEERARRRQKDEVAKARAVEVEAVRDALSRRDALDSNRAVSPLRVADDAVSVDTTGRTIDDIVTDLVERAHAAGIN